MHVCTLSIWMLKMPSLTGLIIVCSVFGVAAAALREQGAPFLAFFRSATDTIVKILRVLIWLVIFK